MNTQINGKLYNLTFQAHFKETTTNIKFPSLFFIEWKTNDHKHTVETGRYSAQDQKAFFDETVTLTVPLVYEKSKKVFLKKESQVQLNLLSKNRPDQSKLVGRVTIDLASIVNNRLYATPTEFPLQFCSVNANLKASFKLTEKVETDVDIFELEKSIGDGISFHSTLKVGQNQHSNLDGSKDSISLNREVSPHNSRFLEKHVVKKQVLAGLSSPKGSLSSSKGPQVQERQEFMSSIFHDSKKQEDKRSQAETKSAKGTKFNDVIEVSNKKMATVLSQESKLGEQNTKLKIELDTLRLEINRQHQQNQKIRLESEQKQKQSQFAKVEIKQKQSSLDQSAVEVNSLRSESHRLREEIAALREEAVNATIKIADLKDNFNRVSAQLSTTETQMKRLEGVNEQSIEHKKNTSSQLSELEEQIAKYEQINRFLENEKMKLQQNLNQKTQEEQKLSQQKIEFNI